MSFVNRFESILINFQPTWTLLNSLTLVIGMHLYTLAATVHVRGGQSRSHYKVAQSKSCCKVVLPFQRCFKRIIILKFNAPAVSILLRLGRSNLRRPPHSAKVRLTHTQVTLKDIWAEQLERV